MKPTSKVISYIILEVLDSFCSLKAKNATYKIGYVISEQINLAMKENSDLAKPKLASLFLAGYVYNFSQHGLASHFIGINSTERYIRRITRATKCVDLYTLFDHQLADLEISRTYKCENQIKIYEKGSSYGLLDARKVNYEHRNPFRYFKSRSLYKYLLGKEMPTLS